MNPNDLLDNIGGVSLGTLSVNLVSILKLPLILFLFGNILFAILLLLRVRILADTFESPQNSIVKTIVFIYLVLSIVGSLVALLFMLIG